MRRGPTVVTLVAVLATVVTACASVTGGTATPVAALAGAAAMAPPAASAPSVTPAPTLAPSSGPAATAVDAPAVAPATDRPATTAADDPPRTAAPDPPAAADPPPADTSTPPPPPPEPAPAPVEPPAEAPNWADASDDEIRSAAADAAGATERFWSETFASRMAAGSSSAAWSPPELWSGDGFYDSDAGTVADCGDGKNYVGNAFFCGNATTGTGFLAWDLQFFHRHLDLGRTMVDMVIAHETGHAVQARLVHDGVDGALFDGSRRYELQADCLGGASLGRAVRDGYLTLPATAPDEMLRVAAAFGGDPAGHGTPEQRDASFQRGFASGDPDTCLSDPGS